MLLCVALELEPPSWTVSQALHGVARDTRADQPGRVPKSPQDEHSTLETLGHNNYQDVARLLNLVKGMTILGGPGHCDPCSTEKAKRAPVDKKWGTRAAER